MNTTRRSESPEVAWVRSLPEGWASVPLLAVAHEHVRRNTGGIEANVLSLSYGRIVCRDVESNFGLLPESFDTYNIVEPGGIVLRLTDLQNDTTSLRVGFVGERGIVTSAYVSLRVGSDVLPKFIFYALYAADVLKVFYALGAGVRQSGKFDDLKRLRLPIVSREVQRAIADFLDRKTAAIDELIRKKERLIELLEEKRQALITQAVTKGLDPNVPTKDSGVEWIGEVPAHWRTPRIGYVARVRNGSTPDRANLDYWDEGTVPWLSSGKVNDYLVTEADQFITEVARRECHLEVMPAHSVIVGLIGQGKTRGTAAITTLPACINQNMAAISTFEGTDPWFLLHVLTSAYWPLREFGRGGQQDALNCQILAAFRIPLPPPDEQDRIVRWIDAEVVRKDGTAQLLAESIDRLREYRQALITGAVTGQLDIPAEPAV